MPILLALIVILLSAIVDVYTLIAEYTTCQEGIVNQAVDWCTNYF